MARDQGIVTDSQYSATCGAGKWTVFSKRNGDKRVVMKYLDYSILREHTFDVGALIYSNNALTTLRTSITSPAIHEGMGICADERRIREN